MTLKRRIKKLSKSEARRISTTHFIICKVCNNEELAVPVEVTAVTCARCVQRMIDPPASEVPKNKKPRGWHHRMYFEHVDGVYSKGVLITDNDEIENLRTLYKDESEK
jgi:hypothetical protein